MHPAEAITSINAAAIRRLFLQSIFPDIWNPMPLA